MVLEETRFKGVSKKYDGLGVIFMEDGDHVVFGASSESDVDDMVEGQYAYHIYVCGYAYISPEDKDFKKYKEML